MPNKEAKRKKQLKAKKRKAIAEYKSKKRRDRKNARKQELS
tara:strand:- start:1197 stop:1319 length:123 start_codon:yes stop_codon:yes gene_type:complete